MTKPDRLEDPRIRSVFIDPRLHEAVAEYADKNGMSVAEVIREAMEGFSTGNYPDRRRLTKRVTMWMEPKKYAAFAKKARDSKITIRQALEMALEKML